MSNVPSISVSDITFEQPETTSPREEDAPPLRDVRRAQTAAGPGGHSCGVSRLQLGVPPTGSLPLKSNRVLAEHGSVSDFS